MASFRSQYGIRLRNEAAQMPWDEFCDLISGLDIKTPLGRMIQIRTETDPEVLKHYTPEMKKIHSDWQAKVAQGRKQDEVKDFLTQMQEAFKRMAGDHH